MVKEGNKESKYIYEMWIGLVRQYADILLSPFHVVSRSVGLQVTPPFQTSLKGGTGELA